MKGTLNDYRIGSQIFITGLTFFCAFPKNSKHFVLRDNKMKLGLELITSNLYNIFISFPKLEFCKRKGKKLTRIFSYLNKVVFSKHICICLVYYQYQWSSLNV